MHPNIQYFHEINICIVKISQNGDADGTLRTCVERIANEFAESISRTRDPMRFFLFHRASLEHTDQNENMFCF